MLIPWKKVYYFDGEYFPLYQKSTQIGTGNQKSRLLNDADSYTLVEIYLIFVVIYIYIKSGPSINEGMIIPIRDGAINKKCTHLHFLAFIGRLLHFYITRICIYK